MVASLPTLKFIVCAQALQSSKQTSKSQEPNTTAFEPPVSCLARFGIWARGDRYGDLMSGPCPFGQMDTGKRCEIKRNNSGVYTTKLTRATANICWTNTPPKSMSGT